MESKNELFSLLFTFPTWRRFLTRQISTYWSQHDPERTITTSKYGRSVLWLASRPGQRILKRRPPLPTPPPVPNAPAIVSANADRHRALIHGQYRTEQHTGVAADGAVWERGAGHTEPERIAHIPGPGHSVYRWERGRSARNQIKYLGAAMEPAGSVDDRAEPTQTAYVHSQKTEPGGKA